MFSSGRDPSTHHSCFTTFPGKPFSPLNQTDHFSDIEKGARKPLSLPSPPSLPPSLNLGDGELGKILPCARTDLDAEGNGLHHKDSVRKNTGHLLHAAEVSHWLPDIPSLLQEFELACTGEGHRLLEKARSAF